MHYLEVYLHDQGKLNKIQRNCVYTIDTKL